MTQAITLSRVLSITVLLAGAALLSGCGHTTTRTTTTESSSTQTIPAPPTTTVTTTKIQQVP